MKTKYDKQTKENKKKSYPTNTVQLVPHVKF
jgi:hypothetical protein